MSTQGVNATYRNIVGRNMFRAFGHRVAMYCNMLGVVDSSLKLVKFEPTTPNMSQQGGQTHSTCCAQQCCDMLCGMLRSFGRGLRAFSRKLLVKFQGVKIQQKQSCFKCYCKLCPQDLTKWHSGLK